MATENSGAAQGSGPVAQSAIQPNDLSILVSMFRLLMEEKAEAAEEKKARKERDAEKDKAYRQLADYNVQEEKKKQTICTHLKGGRGPKNAKIDYAVYHHTFPDAVTYIRCQICGMKWKKGDTQETIRRFGKEIPNHTGIGWQDALRMLSESTNTPTKSEIPVQLDVPTSS